jgi:hypothetical protein
MYLQVRRSDFSYFLFNLFNLVCATAMNDGKSSSIFVKDGIKFLQKRSNPVELFVQKRVKKFIFISIFNQIIFLFI